MKTSQQGKGGSLMKKTKIFFITVAVALLFVGVAIAEMYKWVDENGVIHLSDRPPENAGSAKEVKSIPTYDDWSQSASQPRHKTMDPNSSPDDDSYTVKQSKQLKMPSVELYTTSWCIYSKKSRDYFRSRGIAFTEYDIEKDKSAALRKKQLDTRKGVPFAIINGQRIHGFSETAYTRALEGTP